VPAGPAPGSGPSDARRVPVPYGRLRQASAGQAGLDLTLAAEPAERDAYTAETKAVLFRYPEPVVGSPECAGPDTGTPGQ
jgi:hypothetical protein